MLYCFQELSESYFCVPKKMKLTEYHQSTQSMGMYAHMNTYTHPCTSTFVKTLIGIRCYAAYTLWRMHNKLHSPCLREIKVHFNQPNDDTKNLTSIIHSLQKYFSWNNIWKPLSSQSYFVYGKNGKFMQNMVIHQGVSLMSTYEIPGGVIASQGNIKVISAHYLTLKLILNRFMNLNAINIVEVFLGFMIRLSWCWWKETLRMKWGEIYLKKVY